MSLTADAHGKLSDCDDFARWIPYFSFPWTFPSHRFYVLINYQNLWMLAKSQQMLGITLNNAQYLGTRYFCDHDVVKEMIFWFFTIYSYMKLFFFMQGGKKWSFPSTQYVLIRNDMPLYSVVRNYLFFILWNQSYLSKITFLYAPLKEMIFFSFYETQSYW